MLSIAIAAFFFWLIAREIRCRKPKDSFSLWYIGVCLILVVLALSRPFSAWSLERKLTAVTHELAEFRPTKVQCQSLWASLFDRTRMQWAGYTQIETGDVVFKAGWCSNLRDYLSDPAGATDRERYSLLLLAHEAMHVRGEHNEQKTECQAIQRHYRTGLLMGLPEKIAREDSVRNFRERYPRHPYFSPHCTPGSAMDEQLPDSTWQFLEDK